MKIQILVVLENTRTNEKELDFFHLVQFQYLDFLLFVLVGVEECPFDIVESCHLLHFLNPHCMVVSDNNDSTLYFLMEYMEQLGQIIIGNIGHTFELLTFLQPIANILNFISDFYKIVGGIFVLGHTFIIAIEQMLEIFIQTNLHQRFLVQNILNILMFLVLDIIADELTQFWLLVGFNILSLRLHHF